MKINEKLFESCNPETKKTNKKIQRAALRTINIISTK